MRITRKRLPKGDQHKVMKGHKVHLPQPPTNLEEATPSAQNNSWPWSILPKCPDHRCIQVVILSIYIYIHTHIVAADELPTGNLLQF